MSKYIKIKKRKKVTQKINKDVKKSNFWSAFAAISTATAVIVALAYPIISNMIKTENIKYIINNEILDCHEKALPIFNEVMYSVNPELSIIDIVEIVKNLNTNIWDEKGYDILISDPNSFLRYLSVYKSISDLKKASASIDINKPFIMGDLDNTIIHYVKEICDYLDSDEYIIPEKISIYYTK